MSKRSKEMALKAYPDKVFRYRKIGDADGVMTGESIESQQYIRNYFIEGYEQAEKDTIERAIQWLIAHADDYVVDMEVSRYKPSNLHVGGMCWEHLKQAME